MSTTELAITGVPGVELEPAGLRITEALTPGNYRHVGKTLGRIQGMTAWAIGDWANANPDSKQAVTQEIADIVGLTAATVTEYGRVAARFPHNRRHRAVAWGVHQAVAAQPPDVADRLLDQAERDNWSVAAMRLKVYGQPSAPRGTVAVLNGAPDIILDVAWKDEVADDPDLRRILNTELRRMVEEWEFVKKVEIHTGSKP